MARVQRYKLDLLPPMVFLKCPFLTCLLLKAVLSELEALWGPGEPPEPAFYKLRSNPSSVAYKSREFDKSLEITEAQVSYL